MPFHTTARWTVRRTKSYGPVLGSSHSRGEMAVESSALSVQMVIYLDDSEPAAPLTRRMVMPIPTTACTITKYDMFAETLVGFIYQSICTTNDPKVTHWGSWPWSHRRCPSGPRRCCPRPREGG
jgi:hypothetical protein